MAPGCWAINLLEVPAKVGQLAPHPALPSARAVAEHLVEGQVADADADVAGAEVVPGTGELPDHAWWLRASRPLVDRTRHEALAPSTLPREDHMGGVASEDVLAEDGALATCAVALGTRTEYSSVIMVLLPPVLVNASRTRG